MIWFMLYWWLAGIAMCLCIGNADKELTLNGLIFLTIFGGLIFPLSPLIFFGDLVIWRKKRD